MRFRDEPDDPWLAPPGTIDVWWRGRQNGELMLLLAHLLTKNNEWRPRPIRLLRVIENEAGRDEVRQHLTDLAERGPDPRHAAGRSSSDDPRAAIQQPLAARRGRLHGIRGARGRRRRGVLPAHGTVGRRSAAGRLRRQHRRHVAGVVTERPSGVRFDGAAWPTVTRP